ncbi:manganese transport protein [Halarchaeum rubridurum]|uniref:Divalent metal cation transporter MntH n=1 Tax=Halarchaeum rubridurum TaxID=489911 RepID=A0A830FXU6_9EURY|nr:Nramp family divalent metal transporter [Halarchaeum rubridurum]MBP1954135.1 manganese transport protein [Halarchaeum rubridurum]GGM57630.1 divalent metal cation transporter MntH [Halarchaeum rubridurum]
MSNRAFSVRELLRYLGPGFLISVAYMDPGNWATNISGGARYGTALLWVIVLASLVAMGIQIVAAKLGIATGKGIATLCRERLPQPVVYVLWAAAELAMIATDMAEIIGAAIGFSLVFGLPLWAGAVLAGISSFALLGVRSAHRRGFRAIEFAIMALVGVIALAFVFEVVLARPDPANVALGLAPSIPSADALYVAIGILGATVMPHSVYLHPYIVQDRRADLVATAGDTEDVHRRHFRYESIDTVLALFGAMFVNAAMLVVAAAALTGTGIETLNEAYVTLAGVFGPNASLAFGVALIAAGLSSSLVATMAGQTVMDGFLDWNVNVWIRRSVTLVPSLAVVVAGFEPTSVLVASQVALSFELPFVLIPLVYFTREEGLMGSFVNRTSTTGVLGVVVAVIVALNGWLLYTTLLG